MSHAPPPIDRRALLKEALEAVEQMQANLDAERRRASEPVAIVGMACRFPGGATTPEAYWTLLRDGVDAVKEVPADRWDAAARGRLARAASGEPLVHYGGFLDGIDRFDPKFFGISPREAATMDPQQRLVLEVAWEALERAGQAPDRLAGSATGVFLGITTGDYADLVKAAGPEALDVYMATGNAHNAAAGRVSYVLGLNGPSMAIDTACSSSLVAVHLACQSLRAGESRLALAGGVNVILTPDPFVIFSRWGMMAPDGRCKTFDARADGFVRSEGCGILALKRLSDAQAAGDEILAVIRGSAVNQDGASSGLTVPNGLAQQAVIRQALGVAGVAPADIAYVEAHGTGTALGDPIELEALDAVLGGSRPADRPLVLGSVKTNLGHLESASGVAGLMKVVLALRHGVIPPHLHFTALTPRVSLRGAAPVVPTAAMPWPAGDGPRLAGVSSFGFSGTNAHVVLEAAPTRPATADPAMDRPVHVLALSARSEAALRELAARYAARINEMTDAERLADVCFSAVVGRARFNHRLAVPVATGEQACAALAGGRAAGRRPESAGRPRVAFLFSGQGTQHVGMGRQLYDTCPTFRRTLDRCAEILRTEMDRPLLEVLYPANGDTSPVDQTAYTQPALFALEYALAETWREWGILPSAVLGHSVGEYVAACVAGVMSLEDALALIATRGRLMQALPAGGAMAAVLASESAVSDALRGRGACLAIAAINAPDDVVISGSAEALDEVLQELAGRGVRSRRLNVSHAFHSPLMDPALDEFTAAAKRVTLSAPRIGLVSNVTGRLASAEEITDPGYWRRHLRDAVRFAAGVETLRAERIDAFVEIGPSPTLLALARRSGATAAAEWLPSLRRGRGDWEQMLESLAALYAAGADVDWAAFDRPYRRRRVAVPAYPFERERYWVEPPAAAPGPVEPADAGTAHPLLGRRITSPRIPGVAFESRLRGDQPSFLADHTIHGTVVFPATAYLEAIRVAAAAILGGADLDLEQVTIRQPMVLKPGAGRVMQVLVGPPAEDAVSVEVFGRPAGHDPVDDWQLHASARVRRRFAPNCEHADDSLAAARARCPEPLPTTAFYERMAAVGLDYGPSFRGVREAWAGRGEAVGLIEVDAERLAGLAAYQAHPAVVDACLHLFGAVLARGGGAGEEIYVPVEIERVRLLHPLGARLWARAAVRHPVGDGGLTGDLHLFDDTGSILACVTGVSLRRLPRAALDRAVSAGWLYEVAWRPKALEPSAAASTPEPVRWIILADRGGVGAALAQRLTAAGDRCDVVLAGEADASSADALAASWARATEEPGTTGIVHLWGLDAPSLENDASVCLEDVQRRATGSALHATQALVRTRASAGRLVLVTRGAQRIGAETATAPALAPIWGLGRVIRNEHPELRCVCIDLDPAAGAPDVAALVAELRGSDGEDEIALRASGRWVARLVSRPVAGHGPGASDRAAGGPVRLEIAERGTLDNLRWAALRRTPPGPGQVEIQVSASGLNFRDVLNTLGMYPGEAGALGSECAGLVVGVGEGVEAVRVGDPVIALTNPAFATFAIAHATLVVRKPDAITMEEGATIPIAFLTAAFALREIARIRPGERVLIHAAAGGVGLAAVQIARRAGAEIFATAGSPAKRAHLASLGIAHIMDSRSSTFADEVMERTGGEGIDVVLNALTGDLIPAGLRVLRAGGRFIEIGKRGIWDAERVRREYRGVAYHVLYLGEVCEQAPARAGRLLRELVAQVERGDLSPLPRRTFGAAEVVDAFRYMAQARHIGKVVVTPPHAAAASATRIRADATYLVTGGLGALGLQVARWLHDEGARHLVLMGRSVPSAAAHAAIRALEARGSAIRVAPGDVAREDDVRRVLDEIAASLPPLRGVVHAAGVLDDGLLAQQTWSRFERVMAPKAIGAWTLHRLTRGLPLDLFVLFSSASGLLGAPGQSNYAAASCFLDALAHHRRARGLPALSIDWGPWEGSGMAAISQGLRPAARGVRWITPDQGRTLLAGVAREDLAQIGVLSMDWAALAAAAPGAAARPFLSELVRSGGRPALEARGGGGAASARSRLLAAPPTERARLMSEILRGHFASVLQTSVPALEADDSLDHMGTDSLMAVELKSRIEADTGISIPVTDLLEATRLGDLAAALCRQIDAAAGPARGTASETPVTRGPDADETPAVSVHPMSHGQQALWFLHHLAPESSAYNVLFAARLRSAVDASVLEAALQVLVDRHPALRTTFGVEDGRPVQRVHREHAVAVERIDAVGATPSALRRMVAAAARRPFDLDHGPVLRATVFLRGAGEDVFLLTVHHIAIDGWSFQILFQELGKLHAAAAGAPGELPPLPHRYTDFVRWQDEALAGALGERGRHHWLRELGGELPVLALRTDRPRPPRLRFRGASVGFALSEALGAKLKELAASEKATLYMILLAAYQVLLHRETGQSEILVGSPAAGRTRQEFAPVVGYFVNTVVVRGSLAGDPTFRAFLGTIRDKVRLAVDHQDYPFPLLVKQLGVNREGGRSPIFQAFFNFVPSPQAFDLSRLFVPDHPSGPIRLGDLVMEPFPLPQQEGQFELELEMSESGGILGGRFKYDTDLFDERSIVRFRRVFETLLEVIVSGPDRPVSWIASQGGPDPVEDHEAQTPAREEIDL